MNLLVLAPEPVDAALLRSVLDDDVEGARVLVVSPALHHSPVAFWVSDADEAIGEAEETAQATADALRSEGVQASATAGENQPPPALQDALATFQADRIVVFVHQADEQRYREDDVIGEAQRRFGLPVTEATLP
jgi:nucleotide-binding universal stress UspA family protein